MEVRSDSSSRLAFSLSAAPGTLLEERSKNSSSCPEGMPTMPISHRNTMLQGQTFRFLLNYKNPKSVKVRYWGSKEMQGIERVGDITFRFLDPAKISGRVRRT